jgi:hypothetical protein
MASGFGLEAGCGPRRGPLPVPTTWSPGFKPAKPAGPLGSTVVTVKTPMLAGGTATCVWLVFIPAK